MKLSNISRPISNKISRNISHKIHEAPTALLGGAGYSLPADLASDYFSAINSQGGTISTGNRQAVSDFLAALYEASILRRVIALYLYHGNALNSARLNVINPTTVYGSWVLTWNGTPILNAAGGFTPTASNYGIAMMPDFAGLTEYSGMGMGFYSTSNSSSGEYSMGLFAQCYLAPKEGTGAFCRFSGTFNSVGTNRDLSGFHFACRERGMSSTIRAYRNGVEYGNATKAFNNDYAATNHAIRVGGMFEAPSTHYTSTTPIRLSIVTEGLTSSEVAALNTAVSAYIGSLA